MLIGLIGYAGSGKDTAAKTLIDAGWLRVAFADALKRDVAKIINLNGYNAATLAKPELRPLYVAYGEIMRALEPRHWIIQAAQLIEESLRGGMNVVVTDCRYPNEVDYIRSLGGHVVNIRRAEVWAANETEADSVWDALNGLRFDYTLIENNGTPEELWAAIWSCVGKWK